MKKLLLVLLVLVGANAYAGLNKWVDADGKVHYSDQPPPPNVKAQTLRMTSDAAAPTPASAPAAPKTIAEREADMKKAQQAKEEAADKGAKEQARLDAEKEYCDAAQKNLLLLLEGTRMVDIDASGERSYLSDEQRQQRIEKVRQDIGTYCK